MRDSDAAFPGLPPLDPGRLTIIADAGEKVGAGHVMRTLAVAQAWGARGGRTSFVLPVDGQALAARLRAAGCDVAFDPNVARGSRAIVVDSYRDREALVRAAAHHAPVLVVSDDTIDIPMDAALTVLPGPAWEGATTRTRTLAGARFALLRDSVRSHDKHSPNVTPARVAVTLGGGSGEEGAALLADVLDALDRASAPSLDVDLIVGPLALPESGDRALAARALASRHRVALLCDPPDFIDRLARADVCVSAGGTTLLELAFLGVPTISIVLADNQLAGVARLVELGAARTAAQGAAALAPALDALLADEGARRSLSARARQVIDGDGGGRVVQAVLGEPLRLRAARDNDEARSCSWRNDLTTRAASVSSEPIDADRDACCFERLRANAGKRLFIAVDEDDERAGQIRFERAAYDPRIAEVSVALAPESRGKGLAAPLLILGLAHARAALGVSTYRARVKQENLGSVRAFTRAGFETESDVDGVLTMCREAR